MSTQFGEFKFNMTFLSSDGFIFVTYNTKDAKKIKSKNNNLVRIFWSLGKDNISKL